MEYANTAQDASRRGVSRRRAGGSRDDGAVITSISTLAAKGASLTLSVLCGIVFAGAVFARAPQTLSPPATTHLASSVIDQTDYVTEISDRLDGAFARGQFVGLAVGVVEDGALMMLRTYGETKARSGDPITPDTVFRLASVSKTFASSLLGQMHHEGRVSWDDRVTDYSDRFRLRTDAATQAVTLEHLASHRVGLPPYAYDDLLELDRSLDTLFAHIPDIPMTCRPGTCFAYQNVAFSAIDDVVAAADDRSFAEALQARLFEPLGMATASVGREGLTEARSWARPHSRASHRSRWRSFMPNDDYYRVAPAGGINASILDLSLWVRAQLGHEPQVLSDAVRMRLHAGLVDTPAEKNKLRWMRPRLRDADYGLGWRVYDYAGERVVMHAGGVAGYRALIVLVPERDFGFAALWNAATPYGWRIMPMILDAYLDLGRRDWLGVDRILAQSESRRTGSP